MHNSVRPQLFRLKARWFCDKAVDAEQKRTARVEEKQDRTAANAERMRKARAEQKEEHKAVDAERKRKSRAEEQEDRKVVDAERKRVARVQLCAARKAPYKRPTASAAVRVTDARRKRKWRAERAVERQRRAELAAALAAGPLLRH